MELQASVAEHYKTFSLQTTPKNRAVYLLHEKCIYLLNQAERYLEKRRLLLTKVQNILVQLQTALIGEDVVTDGLHCIYDYAYVRLESGTDDDIVDARQVLLPIKEAFGFLLRKPR